DRLPGSKRSRQFLACRHFRGRKKCDRPQVIALVSAPGRARDLRCRRRELSHERACVSRKRKTSWSPLFRKALTSILSLRERTQVAGVLGIRGETVREAPGEGYCRPRCGWRQTRMQPNCRRGTPTESSQLISAPATPAF